MEHALEKTYTSRFSDFFPMKLYMHGLRIEWELTEKYATRNAILNKCSQ